ncbi:hypothetical protein CC85DRAFT_282202 [Cutaneotrichosporon oleaginosum]|uniref:Uncharacterized protein n=1 Tax=Cutaneotrichosporon oleaginosum TaxID=879819 RepID=A0A0J1BDD0_9TREE|nr:uncharacterized protein CC85DRAFT_282202 [Cutaneotrichosporon oleaginosum]KLT46064.1 hypothetical protein CC85DRAFT_282202 [Cutaneotrichosporon oleaginosum]TXT06757.1 hypothetical protein COLE_06088 [Cutaneotrichosporon oleaginosum]
MRTYSDSERSNGGASPASLADSEDFEFILMPALSASSGVLSVGRSEPTVSSGILSISSVSPVSSGILSVNSSTAPVSSGVLSLESSLAALALSESGEGGLHSFSRRAPSSIVANASSLGGASSRATSHYEDDDSDSDRFDDDSARTRRRSHTTVPTHGQSIVSASDARESIDSFLNDPEFTSDVSNKLRLYQALCIELGLVELEDTETPARSSSSRKSQVTRGSYSDSDDDVTPTASRSTTPMPALPPLPTSIKAADRLLRARGHVNIIEYLEARNDRTRRHEDSVGKYADLVYSSASALQRALRREGKYARLGDVKREWLQPLLKDFGFRRRRESRG